MGTWPKGLKKATPTTTLSEALAAQPDFRLPDGSRVRTAEARAISGPDPTADPSASPPANKKARPNKRNWQVVPIGRPPEGWGCCHFTHPGTGVRCTGEKYSNRGIFCKYHMEAAFARKQKMAQERMDGLSPEQQEAAKAQYGDIPLLHKYTQWNDIDDVVKFTQKLGEACAKGQVTDKQVASLLRIVRVTIKAFDSKFLILKLSAVMKAAQRGDINLEEALDAFGEMQGEGAASSAPSMQYVESNGSRALSLQEVAKDVGEELRSQAVGNALKNVRTNGTAPDAAAGGGALPS